MPVTEHEIAARASGSLPVLERRHLLSVSHISKLDLPTGEQDHRQLLAVLAYLPA